MPALNVNIGKHFGMFTIHNGNISLEYLNCVAFQIKENADADLLLPQTVLLMQSVAKITLTEFDFRNIIDRSSQCRQIFDSIDHPEKCVTVNNKDNGFASV